MIYYQKKNNVIQDFNRTERSVGGPGFGSMAISERPVRKLRQTGGGGRCLLAGPGSFIIKTRAEKEQKKTGTNGANH